MFVPMGTEDQVKVENTVVETEIVKDKVEEKVVQEKKEASSSGFKRVGVIQKSMGRKKRKGNRSNAVEQSSESEHDDEEKIGDEEESDDREKLMDFTVLSKHKEPEVMNAVPLAIKHPIISYTHRTRDGSEAYWEFIKTNGLYNRFIRFSQMLFWKDRDDVVTIRRLYKEKYGDTRPEEVYERVIYYYWKIMFEPNDGDIE